MSKMHRVPLLLTSHGWESEKQSFYSLSDNRYQTKYIAALEGKRILGSAYGWLALTDNDNDDYVYCLWNPESNEKIELQTLFDFDSCVLSKPPTEPDCLAVFKSFTNVEQSVCRICDDEFVELPLREGRYWSWSLVAICSFQEETYGIDKLQDALYELVTIRLVGDTVQMKPLLINGEPHLEFPKLCRSWVSSYNHYLIESPGGTGEFFLVIKMVSGCSDIGDGVEFSVFRVDVKGLVCVELDNIDGLTIFIGTCGNGFCCPSSGKGIKPNSIYYTGHSGRVMCVYDLDDRSTTPLLPCPVAGRYVSVNYWVDLPRIPGSE